MEPISWATLLFAGKILGSLTGVTTALFGVFKVINWIKAKIANIDSNVVELKTSMDAHIGGLRDDIKQQTTTLATALQEQRADFRTFYAPTIMAMQQRYEPWESAPVRAKKPVKRKSRG